MNTEDIGAHAPGDLHQLLLADAEADRALRIERDAERARIPAASVSIAARSTRPWRVGSRPKRFSATVRFAGSTVNSWKTVEMPAARAAAWVAQMHRPAADVQLARIGLVHAGQQLHQRRLAGAVLAGEGVDRAGVATGFTSCSAAVEPKRLLMPRATTSASAPEGAATWTALQRRKVSLSVASGSVDGIQ